MTPAEREKKKKEIIEKTLAAGERFRIYPDIVVFTKECIDIGWPDDYLPTLIYAVELGRLREIIETGSFGRIIPRA